MKLTKAQIAFLCQTTHTKIDNTPPEGIEKQLESAWSRYWMIDGMLSNKGPNTLKLNSCYRSPELNMIVGGQPDSWHMFTDNHCAFDIKDSKLSPPNLAIAVQNCFEAHQKKWDLIFVEPSRENPRWVHVAWSIVPEKNRMMIR